jgi:hypothetical protein
MFLQLPRPLSKEIYSLVSNIQVSHISTAIYTTVKINLNSLVSNIQVSQVPATATFSCIPSVALLQPEEFEG